MKKVFAFLSTFVLTIALVGVATVKTPANAAKFTVDPTLAKDEDPVYIMSSIYTTFPFDYDNDAVTDPGLQEGRSFPWNETRLRIARFNEDGTPSGRYYAVYLPGALNANSTGAAKGILYWDLERDDKGAVKDGARVVLAKDDEGKRSTAVLNDDGSVKTKSGAVSQSLSQLRVNISGQDLEFNFFELIKAQSTNDDAGAYSRMVVFDGQGRMIRGVADAKVYSNPADADGGANPTKFAPEYCYVNDTVTKISSDVTCDKDDAGNDKLVYEKFIWEWFEEKPENVNEAAYLSTGWDPAKWDYCYAKDGGWMCIAFTNYNYASTSETYFTLSEAQTAAYVNSLKAQKMQEGKDEATAQAEAETAAASAYRECIATLRIPTGGFTFAHGYLESHGSLGDKVSSNFMDEIVVNGYKYGRTMVTKKDRNGEDVAEGTQIGIAEVRAYNFSAKPLEFTPKVIDDASYQLLKGQNTVEVMVGNTVKPTSLLSYAGIQKYFKDLDDVTSYINSDAALGFTIYASKNGGASVPVVVQPHGYESFEAMVTDLWKDVNAYNAVRTGFAYDAASGKYKKGDTEYTEIALPSKEDIAGSVTGTNAYKTFNGVLFSTTAGADTFVNNETYWAKWSWVFRYYNAVSKANGNDHYLNDARTAVTSSIGSNTVQFLSFLAQAPQRTSWPNTKVGWDNVATDLFPADAKKVWTDYTIDASMAAESDNWVVEFTVDNSDSGVSSTMVLKFVAVESYTPVIETTAAASQEYKATDVIDPYTLVQARTAQYNGVDILGNDITQNVVFTTDLDFNKPQEGRHTVVATITRNGKSASVTFTVRVKDTTAPFVETRNVTIMQGDDFYCLDGIVQVNDNVDGDLTKATFRWWIGEKVIDTNDVEGESRKVDVEFTVKDSSGNQTPVKYTLTILANNNSNFVSQFDSLARQLRSLLQNVSEVQTSVDSALEGVESVQTAVADLAKGTDEGGSGCKKNNALLAMGLISSTALLAFAFRKRH